jgi:type II secretory pathway component PulF
MTHDAQDLQALNDQILALAKMVPEVDLGFSAQRGAMAEVEDIQRTSQKRERDQEPASLRAILQSEKGNWPPEYFRLIDAGVHCNRLTEPIERAVDLASGKQAIRNQVAVALVYPLLVCLLAAAVLVYICGVTVPELQATYRALDLPTGSRIVTMAHVRDWMPIWIIIVGLTLGAIWYVVAWRRQPARITRFSLAGISRVNDDVAWGEIAELTASLVEQGMPRDEALQRASVLLGSQSVRVGSRRATIARKGVAPPFLNWALDAANDQERADRARTAAVAYREMAARRIDTMGRTLPILFCVLLGGAATLLVGLSLFAPFAQLLAAAASIASPY